MRRRAPDAGARSPENNRGRRTREMGDNNRALREAIGDNRRREELCSSSQASGSREVESREDNNNLEYEKRLRQLRRRMRKTDWAWLSACMGVVEGDSNPVSVLSGIEVLETACWMLSCRSLLLLTPRADLMRKK